MVFKKWNKTEKIMCSLLGIIPILGLSIIIFYWYNTVELLIGIGICGIGFLLMFDLMINVIGIERGTTKTNEEITSHHSFFLAENSPKILEGKTVFHN